MQEGRTSLHVACQKCDVNIVRILLTYGTESIKVVDKVRIYSFRGIGNYEICLFHCTMLITTRMVTLPCTLPVTGVHWMLCICSYNIRQILIPKTR